LGVVVERWLVDVEDNRVVVYWVLQGARQTLEDVLRKLGSRMDGEARLVLEASLNDIRMELRGLESELGSVITLPSRLERLEQEAGKPGVLA